MSTEILCLVALMACAAYVVCYVVWDEIKSTRKTSSSPQTPTPAPQTPSCISEEIDPFVQTVTSLKKQTDAIIRNAQEQQEREIETLFAGDKKIKKKLSRFAQDNELDKALIVFWEEVKHYVTWSTQDYVNKRNRINLMDIASSKDGRKESVEFTHGAQRFKITERGWSGGDLEIYCNISFFEDSEEVFAINCSFEDDDDVTSYNCFEVSTFKKRGNWCKVLLEYYGRIEIERNKSSANSEYSRGEEIKSRFQE